jgi:hypothetical protein
MNDNILSASGIAFKKFISRLTEKLSRPKTKFITDLLCGILFSNNLILTNIASKVPHTSRITAVAKRFRRQLADNKSMVSPMWFNYLAMAGRRLDIDSLFPVDLSDLAKPYARRLENIALVRDGDKGTLVTGYWCIEAYALDKDGILWPILLWPYSLRAEGVIYENQQGLKEIQLMVVYFGT